MTDMAGSEPASPIERAWAALTKPRQQELNSWALASTQRGGISRAAVDRDGRRHLLIPADADEPDPRDMSSSTLSTVTRSLEFSGVRARYVDCVCGDPELTTEFDQVAADVLDAVATRGPAGAVAVEVIDRWRRLFRNMLFRGLQDSAKRGLFAELVVLRSLARANTGFNLAQWRGPLREPHDFETTSACLEVKAVTRDSDRITVNGLSQLSVHDARPLWLVLITVSPDAAGLGIGDLAGELRGIVDEPATLFDLLTKVGWSVDSEDVDRFSVDTVRVILVDMDLPRITEETLGNHWSQAIDDVTYSVKMSALVPHTVDKPLDELATQITAASRTVRK